MGKVKPGIYKHYKGLLVRVIGVGLQSETMEEVVIYEKLEDFNGFKKGSLWVRPLIMFTEKITVDGKKMPRFAYVREKE